MLQKILRFIVFSAIFLMPLFWLPFSVEAFDFNKIYLLATLVLVGLMLWLAKMVFYDKKFTIKWSLLDPFILAFAVVSTIGAFTGIDRWTSIFGFYGKFWPSILGLWAMVGFYFLVTNNIKKTDLPALTKVFTWSSLIVVISSYLAIFNIWAKISALVGGKLPAIMSLRTFSMAGGSLEALAMFLACVSVAAVVFISLARSGKKEIVAYLALFGALGLLIVVDSTPAWLTILLSLILFLVFSFWKRIFKTDVNRLTLATLFAIIAVVFIFVSPVRAFLNETFFAGGLPQEVLLNQKTSWSLAAQGFQEKWLLGEGTGNFHYVFAKFKPAAFLNTQFWQLRFDRAGSYWAELLAEGGALGAFFYLAMAAMFLLISYFFIANKKEKEKGQNVVVIPFVVTVFALLVAQAFYYQTTVLAFMFWLFLALGVVSWGDALREKSFSFQEFPEAGLVFSIVFWLIAVAMAFVCFTMGKYYLADVYYREYLTSPNTNLVKLETATRVAPDRMIYHIALSRAYLQKFTEEAMKAQPDKQVAAQFISGAVQESKTAVAKNPNMVVAYETAGVVYREIQAVVTGSKDWAIKSFQDVLRLEPKNPAVLTELGKLSLVDKKEDEARAYFQRAIDMKADYVDANLQMAYLDDQSGEKEAAQSRLENLVRVSPFSVDAHFQLGRVYYNASEYDKAAEQFQTAITLFPNHSNSLYSLALVYEKQGNYDKALELMNQVATLNPGNKDIEDKIAALRASSQNKNTPAPAEKTTP
ncbi:MAG: tetratricopeptide repeat protein [Candidatus Gribaldobacteria bacterium]|nr:tetratricopeptide repeat protein [Candidatus Gribaldobacteria bacterium]